MTNEMEKTQQVSLCVSLHKNGPQTMTDFRTEKYIDVHESKKNKTY